MLQASTRIVKVGDYLRSSVPQLLAESSVYKRIRYLDYQVSRYIRYLDYQLNGMSY